MQKTTDSNIDHFIVKPGDSIKQRFLDIIALGLYSGKVTGNGYHMGVAYYFRITSPLNFDNGFWSRSEKSVDYDFTLQSVSGLVAIVRKPEEVESLFLMGRKEIMMMSPGAGNRRDLDYTHSIERSTESPALILPSGYICRYQDGRLIDVVNPNKEIIEKIQHKH